MPLISKAPTFVEVESKARRGGARSPGLLSDAALSPSLPALQPPSTTLVQATQAWVPAVRVLGALFPLPSPGQLLPILWLKGPLLTEPSLTCLKSDTWVHVPAHPSLGMLPGARCIPSLCLILFIRRVGITHQLIGVRIE